MFVLGSILCLTVGAKGRLTLQLLCRHVSLLMAYSPVIILLQGGPATAAPAPVQESEAGQAYIQSLLKKTEEMREVWLAMFQKYPLELAESTCLLGWGLQAPALA
jgi:hypothetical protein